MGTTASATTEEKHFKTALTTTLVVRMENGEFALTRVVYPEALNQCVSGVYIHSSRTREIIVLKIFSLYFTCRRKFTTHTRINIL